MSYKEANYGKIPLNYRSFVFQITPKLHFDYHKDYNKTKKIFH